MASESPTSSKQEVRSEPTAERPQAGLLFRPHVDIYESPRDVLLLVDLPGVDEQSIDVILQDDVLTIRGRVSGGVPEGASPVQLEYDIGDFERSFTITEAIDRDRIEATVRHGVLKLVLPKGGEAGPKRIHVKAG